MAVPEKIRKVPRPANTVVTENKKAGPKQYPVRERKGSKYIPGGNPQPINGKVIGYIVDDRYVPLHELTPKAAPQAEMLSYGSSALVKSVTRDLFSDLLDVYPPDDAFAIMAIASLRVIRPSITSARIKTHYERTFVSVDYPGAALSANSVSKLLDRLGKDGKKRKQFYQKRLEAVSEQHHIAIDGMLKQNNSRVNDLSAFSYKGRIKGSRDISLLYAYDIELKEPLCAEVFPGNSIDASSYPAFIRNNDIRKGIIVNDKGFPPSMIRQELKERPDLHFLTPIRRNDIRIANNDMLSFEGVLEGIGAHVVYKKRQIKGGRYLYAFKDSAKAAAHEQGYLTRRERKQDFTADAYAKKKDEFGVIVFESDLDMDAKTVYMCYKDRWLLELVFDRYKNDICLDKTRVQGDFSLIGSEFINFIATVATCRILNKAQAADLLTKMSYGDLMEDLSSAWRMADAPAEAVSHDPYWVHTLKTVFTELEALGLAQPVPQPAPKKRGRPRKNPGPQLS